MTEGGMTVPHGQRPDVDGGGRVALLGAIVFALGSALYLGSPSLSGTNLIGFLCFPIVLWRVFSGSTSVVAVPAVLGFSLLLLLACVSAVAYPAPENSRLLRGVVVAIVASWGGAMMLSTAPATLHRAVLSVLVIATIYAALQASYVLVGRGIDPRLEEQLVESLNTGVLNIGLPSFFGNSNNFSVFAGLVLVYLGVSRRRTHWGWTLLTLGCIVASGSRTVFVLSALWLQLLVMLRSGVKGGLFASVLVVCVVVAVATLQGESGIYVIDRTYFAAAELIAGDVEAGSSLDMRGQSHLYFLEHYGNFMFGSFDASEPFASFRNAEFDDALVRVNPHSFLIELHALFGVFGLAVLVLLSLSLFVSLWRQVGGVLAVGAGAAILFYSAVPSSILQFHLFFTFATLIALGGAGVAVRPVPVVDTKEPG